MAQHMRTDQSMIRLLNVEQKKRGVETPLFVLLILIVEELIQKLILLINPHRLYCQQYIPGAFLPLHRFQDIRHRK